MDYFLGQIVVFPYGFAPMGWMLCNGQQLYIQQNTALFSLISNKFGGDVKPLLIFPTCREQNHCRAPRITFASPAYTRPGIKGNQTLKGIFERMDSNMSNVALNKTADASSYVNPYTPAKGVDGSATPLKRWLGTSPVPPSSGTPAPSWLRVDLGTTYWVNRWVVRQLGAVDWSSNYNLTDYKFQGSLDNMNWFDLDSVTNNSASWTDRTIMPRKVRWVRVYITRGLRCNPNFASIVDFEVYDTPTTDSTLSDLRLNNGTTGIPINPPFVKTTSTYTASVGFDTANITVTPTTTDPNATVAVNGVPVPRGQSSQPVSLTAGGITPVNVVVTPVVGDPQTYTVNVTRASSPYLSGLTVKKGMGAIPLEPSFAKGIPSYNATVNASTTSVNVIATAEESNAAIKINNTSATSGQPFTVQLEAVVNPINIEVTSGTGVDKKLYIINVSKQ